MIIMGIDPGLGCTGVAIIKDNLNILHVDMIKTNIKDPLAVRLLKILLKVIEIIDDYGDVFMDIAIEDQFLGKNFQNNVKIAMAKTSAMIAAAYRGRKVTSYPPATIKKKICNKGNADKEQVRKEVEKVFKDKVIGSNDVSDAIAVAYCHWKHVQNL